MKFSKSDLPLIRLSLITIAVSVLISAAMLFGSNQYEVKIAKDLRAAKKMQHDARNHLATAQEDQENMDFYASEYAALGQSSIFDGDQRLDWIETLDKIRQQHHVNNFSYVIAPQSTYAPKPPIDSGNFNLLYSEMHLKFDLLHEGQLVSFFTTLRSQINGWYQLEGCNLYRVGQATPPNNISAAKSLKAECTGGWITLKNRSAS